MSAKPVTQNEEKTLRAPSSQAEAQCLQSGVSAASARSKAFSDTLMISSASREKSQSNCCELPTQTVTCRAVSLFASAFLHEGRHGGTAGAMPGAGSELPTTRGSARKSSLREVQKSRDEEPKKDL